MEIKILIKEYEVLAKKYKLANFNYLNENFEIDKIDKETESLLRVVRKVLMEKIVNSLSFLELLINPVNVPKMYMNYARSMSVEDRKIIEDIYNALGSVSLASLDLEIDSSEKKEAEIIKKIVDTWDSQKSNFKRILTNMKKPNNVTAKKEKSYFG